MFLKFFSSIKLNFIDSKECKTKILKLIKKMNLTLIWFFSNQFFYFNFI